MLEQSSKWGLVKIKFQQASDLALKQQHKAYKMVRNDIKMGI